MLLITLHTVIKSTKLPTYETIGITAHNLCSGLTYPCLTKYTLASHSDLIDKLTRHR